jgi:hypothetical protein
LGFPGSSIGTIEIVIVLVVVLVLERALCRGLGTFDGLIARGGGTLWAIERFQTFEDDDEDEDD